MSTNDAGAGGSKGGLGDDQGTRVGAPEPGPIRPAAHNDGDTGRPERHLGSAGQAAEGIHGANAGGSRDESRETSAKNASTGTDRTDGDQAGSEPLSADRKTEHRSGYGGDGGAPKTSSDTRE